MILTVLGDAGRELWGDLRRLAPSGMALALAVLAAIVAVQFLAAVLKATARTVLAVAQVAVGVGLALAAFGFYDDRDALLRAGLAVCAAGAATFLFGLWGALAR